MKYLLTLSMLCILGYCKGQSHENVSSIKDKIQIINRMDSLLDVIDAIQDTTVSLQLKALKYWGKWDKTGITYYHKVYEKYVKESNEKIEKANVLIALVFRLKSQVKLNP